MTTTNDLPLPVTDESLRTLEALVSSKTRANRRWAEKRRQRLSAGGYCINGEHHGPAINGGCRCAWCHAVHKFGVIAVLTNPNAPARPPGYRLPRNYDVGIAPVPESAGADVRQTA